MSNETIIVEQQGYVAKITLNRPQRLNAINAALGLELKEALTDIAENDQIRVLVITGSPRVKEKDKVTYCFSAGWDLSETAIVEPVVEMIAGFEKPVIAMVNGFALGGGCEIAMACDFIFVSDNSRLGQPEISRGFLPGWGGTQRLPRRVGLARAKRLIMTGEHITGQQAKEFGLADEVLPMEKLEATVMAFAEKLAEQAPLAIRKIKEVMNSGMDTDVKSGLDLESEASAFLGETEDFREGVAAFLEKREPNWKGK